MNYILIAIIFALGVGYHIMQKVISYKKQFPALKRREIFATFFREEWDSLIVSGLVLSTMELAMFIIDKTNKTLPVWITNWGMWVLPLIMGYAGQRIAYKWLGTASEVLERKVENKINSI